jgi:hypothetical protein
MAGPIRRQGGNLDETPFNCPHPMCLCLNPPVTNGELQ